jgi:hypothetical protein
MVFIQTLNKLHIIIKNTKDIQFINLICNQQPPNNLAIYIYFIQINLCKNIMKMCSLTH